MSQPVNILVVDDSESDAELAMRTLRRDGFEVQFDRVESAAGMMVALRRQSWDAVISDYNMPGFTGLDAIGVFKASGFDIPFLLVSGAVGEETAVAAMKAGATDYVMKNNLGRLAPALKRELQDAANRAAQRRGQHDLARSEERLRTIIATEPECVKVVAADGRLLEMNPAGLAMLEADSLAEVQSRPLLDFLLPEHRAAFVALHQRVMRGESGTLEFEVSGLQGGKRWLETHAAPLRDADGRVVSLLGVTRDVTGRRLADAALRESEARFRSLTDLSSDWYWEQDEQLRFIDRRAATGSRSPVQAERFGKTRWEDIPDADQNSPHWAEHRATLEKRLPFRDFEYGRISKDGVWRYVSVSGMPIFDDKGDFKGYRGVGKDLTERRRTERELQQFRMAMDMSPDSIYITDPVAMRFVYANNAAGARVGYSVAQLLEMGPQDLLEGGRAQADREFADVLAGGDDGLKFERIFLTSDGSRRWTELHRRSLRIADRTMVVTMGRDITERKQADERIRRLNRVYAVLSGINALIVRARDRDQLFKEACRIAVTEGNFAGAWVGLLDREAMLVNPIASHGVDEAYIRKIPLGNLGGDDALPADESGLTRQAIMERAAVFSADMDADPRIKLKEEARDRGFRSAAIVPLFISAEVVGVLALYAAEQNFFDDAEMKLLNDLAGDIAFAIDKLQQAERLQVEAAERLRAEAKVARLNRVYAVLSGINSTIVRVENRGELFKEACRIAVEAGNFRAAWIGIVDRSTNTIVPVAWQGLDNEYIQAMPVAQIVASDGIAPEKMGLGSQAIMQKKPMITADMSTDPRILLRKEAQDRGFQSLAMLPLIISGEAVGVMALYAAEAGFFDEEEMKLLLELAGDIAFALDHIDKASKLDYLAYYDSLTGLANRALFHERLSQYMNVARQGDGKLALVLLDVERFKTINDSLGRQAGDELLKQLATRLGQATDAGNVARTGVDHFAIVLPVIKGRSEAARTVERIWRECFAQSFQLNGTELRITAKSGIALYPGDGADAETLHAHAESALQQAKETGERHLFHSSELTAGVANQFALENRLRLALENDEFVLHYQPKLDSETRRIVGVEALIRWQSPELGLVPPAKFIPLMEETGLILEAGAWALKRASLDHRAWVTQGLQAPRVAVNVSAIQLRQRDFVASVEQAIIEGVVPTGIDLELTESLIMEDVKGSIEKLNAVRQLGVQIAIDDFGTGYSSLAYLARLPVQTLKIDRSFIITMLNNADTMMLVQTIISLAHSLRLKVVAEGVDAEEQAKMLRLLRCDEMQGFLFSKPVPFEQMTALLLPDRLT